MTEKSSIEPVIICPRCGAENPLDAQVCSQCGRKLQQKKKTFSRKKKIVILHISIRSRIKDLFVRPHKILGDIATYPEYMGPILIGVLHALILMGIFWIGAYRFYTLSDQSVINSIFLLSFNLGLIQYYFRILFYTVMYWIPAKLFIGDSFKKDFALVGYAQIYYIFYELVVLIIATIYPASNYDEFFEGIGSILSKEINIGILTVSVIFCFALGRMKEKPKEASEEEKIIYSLIKKTRGFIWLVYSIVMGIICAIIYFQLPLK